MLVNAWLAKNPRTDTTQSEVMRLLAAVWGGKRPKATSEQLKPLLSDEVYAAFGQVISGREQRKESMAFTFVGFKDVKIVHAALKGRSAEITLAFGAQFISATTDQNASVIDGDSKTVRDVTDVWTFARDVRSRDPNWLLVATSGALP